MVCKDEMDEQGFKEMSEIEKTLGFAEKDWDYDTRNLEKNDNGLQLIIENKLKKYVKNQRAQKADKQSLPPPLQPRWQSLK